eukprot:80004-Hanusia_phi.AAC.1
MEERSSCHGGEEQLSWRRAAAEEARSAAAQGALFAVGGEGGFAGAGEAELTGAVLIGEVAVWIARGHGGRDFSKSREG